MTHIKNSGGPVKDFASRCLQLMDNSSMVQVNSESTTNTPNLRVTRIKKWGRSTVINYLLENLYLTLHRNQWLHVGSVTQTL